MLMDSRILTDSRVLTDVRILVDSWILADSRSRILADSRFLAKQKRKKRVFISKRAKSDEGARGFDSGEKKICIRIHQYLVSVLDLPYRRNFWTH